MPFAYSLFQKHQRVDSTPAKHEAKFFPLLKLLTVKSWEMPAVSRHRRESSASSTPTNLSDKQSEEAFGTSEKVAIVGKLLCNIRDNLNKSFTPSSHRHGKTESNGTSSMTKKKPEVAQFEIASRISQYLTEVFKGTKEPHPLFLGENEPPISFLRYVERLIKLTNKWAEEGDGPDSFGVRCAILAVEYLERLDFQLTSRSMHRYFMAAFLLGIKLIYDYYISNSFWAEVSGCPRKQVNLMEVQLCNCLNWDFTVQAEKHEISMIKFVRI